MTVQRRDRLAERRLSRLRRLSLPASGPVLLAERLIDIDHHLALPPGDGAVGSDRGQHIAVGLAIFNEARLDVQRLCGDVQTLGDLVENLRARLAKAALDLAQVGIGDPCLGRELAQRNLRLPPLLADVLTNRPWTVPYP
jgi:hypothetical protein